MDEMHIPTDNYSYAERIIRGVIPRKSDMERTFEICKWLLSFNEMEKHRVKCYMRDDDSIRFCFDRGGDCNAYKIQTVFLTIKNGFTLIFRLRNTKFPYLIKTGEYYKISSDDARKLPMDVLKKHILDAYCNKLRNPKYNLSSVFYKPEV